MVGRIMNKVRNLWIMIISMLIFLGIAAAVFFGYIMALLSKPKAKNKN
jgi:flagellar basal body-associated protein FliL